MRWGVLNGVLQFEDEVGGFLGDLEGMDRRLEIRGR